MNDQRYEIRIAGSGGQGVILAAVIVGEALALYEEGLNVVQTQVYGPEARGGASKAEVVVSRGKIDYPKATNPNLQVILTQKACDDYVHDAFPNSIVIVDDFFVTEPPKINANIYSLPIVRTAIKEVGREIVTNMVALGTIARVLEKWQLARAESIRKAILDRVPKGTEDLNTKAFELGYALMKEKL